MILQLINVGLILSIFHAFLRPSMNGVKVI